MPPSGLMVCWPVGAEAAVQTHSVGTRDASTQTSCDVYSGPEQVFHFGDDCCNDAGSDDDDVHAYAPKCQNWEDLLDVCPDTFCFDPSASRRKYRHRKKMPHKALPVSELLDASPTMSAATPPPSPRALAGRRFEGRLLRLRRQLHGRGFGFLSCPDLFYAFGDKDIFIHQRDFGNFEAGDTVAFVLKLGSNGEPYAIELARTSAH